MREFVPDALGPGLDFSGLQRVNSNFYVDRGSAQRREGDVIWRLPVREGTDIYLLIEFQSKNDWSMAVRTQVYQGLLWQQVIDENMLDSGARLPPLLLLVLYNGMQQRWRAPAGLAELIGLEADSALWRWQPQVRYHVLDMGAFAEARLARRTNLVALLFRLERRNTPEQFKNLIDEVDGWFKQHPGCEALERLFRKLISRGINSGAPRVPVANEFPDMKTNVETWGRDWKAELQAEARAEGETQGRTEGRAKGMAVGKAQGKAEALVSLLVKRFGALGPSFRKKIRGARLATVERWFDRAIDAPNVSSVFGRTR